LARTRPITMRLSVENNEGDDHDEIDDDLLGDTSAAWKMHPRRMEFNPRHKKSET
jgi:hypothetical protein